MSLTINQNITSTNFTSGRRSYTYIVIHNVGTASTAKGAAKANTTYFKSTYRGASAHLFVDEEEIWQCVALEDTAWHCGTSGTPKIGCYNSTSIGIELCGNSTFPESEIELAAELVQYLMEEYDIDADHVVRHYDVTGKACPAAYIDSSTWATLKARLVGSTTSSSTSSTSSSSSGKPSGAKDYDESPLAYDGYFGPLTTKYLQRRLRAHGYYPASKYVIDGDFGYYTALELQRYLRALGYYTTAYKLDGDFGEASTKALQSYLKALKVYWDESGWCLVDGDWGELTTIALQRAINGGIL